MSDFLFADKPAGATTHTSLADRSALVAEINDGLCEYLAARTGAPLFVSHRLDLDTTGCLVFARTAAAAEVLREAFADRRVKKRYLFLTDQRPRRAHFTVESMIERRGSSFISEPASAGQAANARTHFQLLEESDGLFLWEARPETGRPHQIRLHAAAEGLAILGDRDHGGSSFATLCLHSENLTIPLPSGELSTTSPAPRWFTRRDLARDPLVMRWLTAIDRRERLLRSWSAAGDSSFDSPRDRTLRWLHSEVDPLRAEQLGSVYWLSWFRERPLSREEERALERLTEEMGWNDWALQYRFDRGRSPNSRQIETRGSPPPDRWVARENGLLFEFRAGQGLSPGLFLDQRRNRAWVRGNATGLRVLNLFCYTGGFSVAAASGQAKQVVSVDLSKVFLEWTKVNFTLNDLPLEEHEFRAMDSRSYLSWAKKKELRFDLVICDPPSFSRSDKGVFKIEQELESLLQALIDVTADGGRVLFATNFEGWDADSLEFRALAFCAQARDRRLRLERTPSPDWDFELPTAPRNMKSFFIVPERS